MTRRDGRSLGEMLRPQPRTGVFARIEDHLARPGDTATRRFQKMVVVLVSLVGSAATVFNALPFFRGGLTAMGWTYMASAFFLLVGGLTIIVRPSLYVPVTFVLLLDVLIFPSITQVQSGGIASGLYALPWAIFAPLGAGLALGLGAAAIQTGLFVATVVVVALLEPYATRIAPDISTDVIVSYNIPSLLSLGIMAAAASLYLLRQVDRFRSQADSLLHEVLPDPIAARLKAGEQPIADRFDGVTVLFADIVDFTRLSSTADPAEIVGVLDDLFSDFDVLAAKHGIQKIKTIGDEYMAASGLPEARVDHAEAMVDFAVDLLAAIDGRRGLGGEPIHLRIGINSGPAVAGVIGREGFIYDLWGDTVNMASRMETNGQLDRIQVTRSVVDLVGDRFRFEERGPIPVKGKGMTVTYFVADEPRIPA
jgi:adenylate cyclase